MDIFANFLSNYSSTLSFQQGSFNFFAQQGIPGALGIEPAFAQEIQETALIVRVKQFKVEERFGLIGIDDGEYKAFDTQNGLAGELVGLGSTHFASERDGADDSNDDDKKKKKPAPVLTRKTGRVTVILPPGS